MAKVELDIEGHDTLGEAMDDFASALRARNRSSRTIQSYAEAVTLFERFQVKQSRPIEVGLVARSDVEAFVVSQLDAHKSSSASVRFRSLRAYFNWLAKTNAITESPMAGMTTPTVQEPIIDIVTPDEIRALLKVTSGKTFDDYRDNALFRVFYDTGARLDEVAGLGLDSFDRVARTMLVLGKGNKFRVVPYGNACERALRYYLRAREGHRLAKSPKLWLGSQDKPLTPNGIGQLLRRRCEQAGISKINPHRFRHTAAANAKDNGLSEGEMMTLFGWKSLTMVQRYGRVVAERQALDAYRLHGAPGDSL